MWGIGKCRHTLRCVRINCHLPTAPPLYPFTPIIPQANEVSAAGGSYLFIEMPKRKKRYCSETLFLKITEIFIFARKIIVYLQLKRF